MPKVSVIVPNYNHGKYLEERLRTIFNQTYEDYEVILLDDCSKDNSREILKKYSEHSKVSRIVINTENSGSPYKQWSKGISLSTGEYIWIAESDDFADESFLETLVKVLDDNDKIGISYCQSWRVDENSKVLFSCSNWLGDRWKQDFSNNGIDEFNEFGIFSHGIFNASAVLFRKAVFNKISSAFLGYRFVGDDVLWCEMLWNGDVAYSSKNLNYFRLHASNTSGKMVREGVRLIEGYRCLRYFNNEKNCSKEISFRKKLKFLGSTWSKNLVRSSYDRSTNKQIFKEAARIDSYLLPRLVYHLLREFLIEKKVFKQQWAQKK
ncbi:MAG: glycosyl transferase family 2 [Segetibacter sp.]|nr:glycosyl transferase family 2 [Segetibacter sp.]